jgi:hypothetical protein
MRILRGPQIFQATAAAEIRSVRATENRVVVRGENMDVAREPEAVGGQLWLRVTVVVAR